MKAPKVLKGHDDHVITCLQFFGNRVVSGSDDNTLKVGRVQLLRGVRLIKPDNTLEGFIRVTLLKVGSEM